MKACHPPREECTFMAFLFVATGIKSWVWQLGRILKILQKEESCHLLEFQGE
jgi:hypothetical protein